MVERMNGPTSLTETVVRWADDAAARAARGEVSEENLRALLGSDYDPGQAWDQARAGYTAMLDRLQGEPLVLKLVVPLMPRPHLELLAPTPDRIEAEVDRRFTPPMLLVHAPSFQRTWDTFEKYQRPYDELILVDESGRSRADPLYFVFRDEWELADGAVSAR